MMRRVVFGLLALGACTKAGTGHEPGEPPPTTPVTPPTTPQIADDPAVKAPPVTPPPVTPPVTPPVATVATKVTVVMTAATLADDCGGAAPTPPAPPQTGERQKKADSAGASFKMKRKCEQTSMQLSVTAAAGGAPTQVHVKTVELFDDAGVSLGVLAARSPTLWSDTGEYLPWDEKIAAAQKLSVSYRLARPNWAAVKSRWNKTYVLKAVLTVDSTDQTVKKEVHVEAETILPPNVKT